MSFSLFFKALAAWLAMLFISVVNGGVRDLTYGQQVSELTAHQLSTLISIVLLGGVMWHFMRRYPLASAQAALLLGLLWSSLTLAFEFLFFHYLANHAWSELLANYDVMHGRLWVFVVLWLLIAPYVFSILRRR